MECDGCIHKKICELWSNAEGQDASCYNESCKETLTDILGDDYDLDRLRELVEADRDGRCVVLPTVKKKDRESLLDALSEAVSSWGDMSKGEKKLSEAILDALKGEQN